jgi:hypothetical protein
MRRVVIRHSGDMQSAKHILFSFFHKRSRFFGRSTCCTSLDFSALRQCGIQILQAITMERKTTVSITLGVASDGRSVRCDFNLAPSPMATAAPALAAPVVPPPVPPRKKAVPRQLFAPEEGNTPKSIWAAWNDEDVPNGKVVDLKGNSVTTLNSPDCVATVMDAPPFLMALDDLNMPEEKSKRTTSMRSSSTQTTAHEPWVAFAAVIVAICITCCSAMLLRSAFTFDADDSSYSGLQAAGCASQTPTTPPLEPMLLLRGTRHHAFAHMRLLQKGTTHSEEHRTYADASSVPLLPPFHPSLVASPALAFAWTSVRRAGQRLAAGFGHGAKKLFKVPVAVDTPHGEGDDNEQEADLIRQHLRFIDL